MPARYVRLIFLAAIGALFALAVTWVRGPYSSSTVTSAGPARHAPAAGLDDGERPNRSDERAPSSEDREPREPAPASGAREVSARSPAFGLGRAVAAAGAVQFDLVDGRAVRTEPVASGEPPAAPLSAAGSERPLGWCFRSTVNSTLASDSSAVWNGARSALVSKHEGVEPDHRVNLLWQGVDAVPYRASRIELSAYVQSVGGVFLFMHATTKRDLSLADNRLRIASSNNRFFALPASGWTRLSIVADIPAAADVMYYGVANNGRASLRVDDVRLARVAAGSDVTRTASENAPVFLSLDPSAISAAPFNLDFELANTASGNGALPAAC